MHNMPMHVHVCTCYASCGVINSDKLLIARVCTVLASGIVKKHTPTPGSQPALPTTPRKPTGKKQGMMHIVRIALVL